MKTLQSMVLLPAGNNTPRFIYFRPPKSLKEDLLLFLRLISHSNFSLRIIEIISYNVLDNLFFVQTIQKTQESFWLSRLFEEVWAEKKSSKFYKLLFE